MARNTMAKTLYMLIGPKGSGKTHIGSVVGRHTGIVFLRVEPIWLGLEPGEDGWSKVEAAIDSLFRQHDKLMIESLGVGEGFARFRASLAKKYTIRMIRVYAEAETCLTRVKTRDHTQHIPVSDDRVQEYNLLAAAVVYDWDLEINNNEFAAEDEILKAIQALE